MAEAPGKDVFSEGDGEEEFHDVTDTGAAESPDDAGTVADSAADDDIEVVLAADDAGTETEDDDALSAGGEDDLGAEETNATAEDELDEEAKGYSKTVQKRILREVRAKRRGIEAAQAEVITEREGRINERRSHLNTQKHLGEVLLANVGTEIRDLTAQLRVAKDEDDTDKEIEIQGKLAELQGKKSRIEEANEGLKTAVTQFEAEAKRVLEARPEVLPPATQAWLDRNAWLKNPRLKPEARYVIDLDKQLAHEKKIPIGTPEYFAELDRRIAREMPDLKVKRQTLARRSTTSGEGEGGRQRTGSVAPGGRPAPGRSGSGTVAGGKRTVTLNAQDLENMRNFKLDPNDPKSRLEYARNKIASDRTPRT